MNPQTASPIPSTTFPVAAQLTVVTFPHDLGVIQMTTVAALATAGDSPQHVHQSSLGRRVKDQAVVLAATHESTRLLLVVGQPLGQETHLTVSMSAAQTDPAEILCQDQVPLLIQRLCAEVGATV